MSSIICKILISDKLPAKSIILSRTLMKDWKLKNGQFIKVGIGNQSVILRALGSKHSGNDLFFSPTIARQLMIHPQLQIRAKMWNQQLKLGPVIGILTTGFTGNPLKPFGGRSTLFKSFIQAGNSEKPLIYVFTPEMINWQTKTVSAWYFKNSRWSAHPSPLPDVVYERIPNRKAESLARVKSCIQRLKNRENCLIFNQGFFNKWSVHLLLSNHPKTAAMIPETYLSPTLATIENMLKKHYMVYLKPSGGSLGLGIFRITYHPKEGYYCRFHQGEQNVLHRFQTLEKCIQHYFAHQPGRFRKYLVQQGIRLIKHHQRAVDFRIHLHKDSNANWQVVAIGSKMAGTGSVTTHIRTGGAVLSTYDLLRHVFQQNANAMEIKLKQKAKMIAQVLEEQIDGPLGELGMDIGIDQNGHIWLFEINAKPGRHIFHHPTLRKAGRLSAKYITDYSLKLANFI